MRQTYFKTVMIGVDDLASAILLDRNDMSISAACGLVWRGPVASAPLALHPWQHKFLSATGAVLEFFWPGHCEGACDNDILRGKSAITLLTRHS